MQYWSLVCFVVFMFYSWKSISNCTIHSPYIHEEALSFPLSRHTRRRCPAPLQPVPRVPGGGNTSITSTDMWRVLHSITAWIWCTHRLSRASSTCSAWTLRDRYCLRWNRCRTRRRTGGGMCRRRFMPYRRFANSSSEFKGSFPGRYSAHVCQTADGARRINWK